MIELIPIEESTCDPWDHYGAHAGKIDVELQMKVRRILDTYSEYYHAYLQDRTSPDHYRGCVTSRYRRRTQLRLWNTHYIQYNRPDTTKTRQREDVHERDNAVMYLCDSCK